MTAYGTVESAVAAMKQGAYDYVTKPFSGDELILAVERAIERCQLVRENEILRAALPAKTGERAHVMIGAGAAMSALRERIERVADSHSTVLITGESGSGKEVAARQIHELSPRREAPFLAINCAALSTSLLESELFGHERGAFTGADRLRKGRFELADGGTLLLDEISEIAPSIQAKLLRVLQEQSFERVGSSRPLGVDVRVIATTNRDLPAEVAKGTFRDDLFYRLNVLPLAMPPLRDRCEDVAALAAHFLARIAQREGRPARRFTEEATERLRAYAWPGNVRELQNVCERAAVLTRGEEVGATLIQPWLTAVGGIGTSAIPAASGPASATVEAKPLVGGVPTIVCDGALTLDDVERETIVATLQHNHGHRQRSAKALGIGVRTLGLKLKKWKEQRIVAETL
jgi:DNA-binding NtrC family response regulator